MILKNANVHVGDGTVFQGDIRVEGGKIVEVGTGLAGEEIRDLTGKDVFPGFIDGGNFLGTQDMAYFAHDWNEDSAPVTPYLDIWHSIDPDEISLQELYKSGFTSMVASPGNDSILGGTCSVVKTKGKNINKITVRRDVALKASFTDQVINVFKAKGGPKTPMAMANMLKQALEAENSGSDYRSRRTRQVMDQVKKGEMPIVVACETAVQMERFLDVVKDYPDMKILFTLAYQADRVADKIKERKAGVILGDTSRSSQSCEYGVNFDKLSDMAAEGIPFCMTLMGPDMSWGRECVFWNLSRMLGSCKDPEAMVKMVTTTPAELFGVSDRIGAIREGLDADLLIYKGNPFVQVGAVLEEVMIQGEVILKESGKEA